MTSILKMPITVKKRSKDRPKSLILLIPAKARDIMEIKADEQLCLKICKENDKKVLKLEKID